MLTQASALRIASLAVLAGVSLVAETSHASWREVTPPAGDAVAVVFDSKTPSTLYVGADKSRVFRSTDGGGTWSASYVGMRTSADYGLVTSVALDPTDAQIVYAANLGAGVFRSQDGGVT
jgi:photosystem II stability/assembly factor-like uncharacterized protein